jgi:hypothetical protein
MFYVITVIPRVDSVRGDGGQEQASCDTVATEAKDGVSRTERNATLALPPDSCPSTYLPIDMYISDCNRAEPLDGAAIYLCRVV